MKTHVEIACNNNNIRNPSLHFISWGYACCQTSAQLPQSYTYVVRGVSAGAGVVVTGDGELGWGQHSPWWM